MFEDVDDSEPLPADPTNRVTSQAVVVEAAGERRIGWIPDYLLDTLHRLGDEGVEVSLTVEHVNGLDVESHRRVRVRLVAPCPEGFVPFDDPRFVPR